jgi:hypothetical protein
LGGARGFALSDAADVLGLAQVLHGCAPRGELFQIPAYDLNFGEQLSALTEAGAREVVREIRDWVGSGST